MTLDRLRRIGIVLFILCALPVIVAIPWGNVAQLVIDATYVVMGVVLFSSFAHMFATAWSGTLHS